MKILDLCMCVLAGSLVACNDSGGVGKLTSLGIPSASSWNMSSVNVQGGGAPPTMSVEDVSGGVRLTYDAPTAGLAGATWMYEFTTTATGPGVMNFDVTVEASHGLSGTLLLQTVHNDSVVRTLALSTGKRTFSMTFPNEALILDAGDTWGIGVTDGSVPGTATADIMITAP